MQKTKVKNDYENKELIVRKRVVNFIEKVFDYLKYDFRHDVYKSVVYDEIEHITPFEERAKNYMDAYMYLLSNKSNELTSILIKKFIYLIKGYEEQDVKLQNMSSKYFYLDEIDPIDKATRYHLEIYKELDESYNEEEKILIPLMIFNFLLVKQGIPCIQLLCKELAIYKKLRETNDERIYEFLKEIVRNNKTQDKSYYRNLKEISLDEIKEKIREDKDILISLYKVKSIYIFGSFSKRNERIDSDIDLAIKFSNDLTSDEVNENIEAIKNRYLKVFNRFIDIQELTNILRLDLVKKTKEKIKII